MTATRRDHRDAAQIRPLEIVQGVLHRADGSAQFDHAPTAVLCGVYGPTEIKIRDEKVDRATLEVNYKPAIGSSNTKDRWIEYSLRRIFEGVVLTSLHPSTLIQLNLQVISDHGSVLAAAFNSATVALMDAGVPMRTVVASVSCAIDQAGNILMDPDEEEEKNAMSCHVFVFDAEMKGALFTDSLGDYTPAQFEHCYQSCKAGAAKMIHFMRAAVEVKLTRQTQQA
ncbi:exosome non-catalytic core subunit rrp46 [Dimargaris xerosporica]|nr:exosome non-catalytic core subunit rrp46 [Dimargaris xerosporica]